MVSWQKPAFLNEFREIVIRSPERLSITFVKLHFLESENSSKYALSVFTTKLNYHNFVKIKKEKAPKFHAKRRKQTETGQSVAFLVQLANYFANKCKKMTEKNDRIALQ